MKLRIILPFIAVVLPLLGTSCHMKCQSITSLDLVPLDARDSVSLSVRFSGAMNDLSPSSYDGVLYPPSSDGSFLPHPMQASTFCVILYSDEPSLKDVNSFFEISNRSDTIQRVLLFPFTDIDDKGASTSSAWSVALDRVMMEVITEMNGYMVANNTCAADSLWNILKAYNTRATVTLAPGETYQVLFQVR